MSHQPLTSVSRLQDAALYLLAMLVSVLTGRRRSFSADARWLLGRLAIPPRTAGEEHIPAQGPFVVVANHYQRPGLWVAWGVCLVSMAVARRRLESPEVRWAMAGEWRARPLGPLPWPAPFLRWLFRRVAATYGHVVVPTADFMSAGRAQAARAMLRALRPQTSGGRARPLGTLARGAQQPGPLPATARPQHRPAAAPPLPRGYPCAAGGRLRGRGRPHSHLRAAGQPGALSGSPAMRPRTPLWTRSCWRWPACCHLPCTAPTPGGQ